VRLFATTVAVLGLVAGALAVQGGAQPPSGGWQTRAGASAGVTIRLPSDWRIAQERLVPKLLAPREILSAGTFEMTPGGGGNCGMYPVVAMRHMRPNDRLITIMRRAGKPGNPWFTRFPQWSRKVKLPTVGKWTLGSRPGHPAATLWTAELALRRGGDQYSVFAAFGRRPTAATVHRVERILGTLEV
jgi:hypothetical protein